MLKSIIVAGMLAALVVAIVALPASAKSLPGKYYQELKDVKIVAVKDPALQMRSYDPKQPINEVFKAPKRELRTAASQVPIGDVLQGKQPPEPAAYWEIYIADDWSLVIACKYNDDGELQYCDIYA